MVFLIAAVLQFGVMVLIPAVIRVFATATTAKAVIFLIWCIIVALTDNVLKPTLLGRGVAIPIAVVFLGAIGGFVALGIIGLFLGAIVLSVRYKLHRLKERQPSLKVSDGILLRRDHAEINSSLADHQGSSAAMGRAAQGFLDEH